jgi:hypothetical protein
LVRGDSYDPAGNIGAATILGGMLRDFEEIDLALFVGVAGSPKSDAQIGHLTE